MPSLAAAAAAALLCGVASSTPAPSAAPTGALITYVDHSFSNEPCDGLEDWSCDAWIADDCGFWDVDEFWCDYYHTPSGSSVTSRVDGILVDGESVSYVSPAMHAYNRTERALEVTATIDADHAAADQEYALILKDSAGDELLRARLYRAQAIIWMWDDEEDEDEGGVSGPDYWALSLFLRDDQRQQYCGTVDSFSPGDDFELALVPNGGSTQITVSAGTCQIAIEKDALWSSHNCVTQSGDYDTSKCADRGEDCCASDSWGEPQACADGYVAVPSPVGECQSTYQDCPDEEGGIGCYACYHPSANADAEPLAGLQVGTAHCDADCARACAAQDGEVICFGETRCMTGETSELCASDAVTHGFGGLFAPETGAADHQMCGRAEAESATQLLTPCACVDASSDFDVALAGVNSVWRSLTIRARDARASSSFSETYHGNWNEMCSEPARCPFIHCDSGNLFTMLSNREKWEWLQILAEEIEQRLYYLTPSSYTKLFIELGRSKNKMGGDDLGGAGWGWSWREKTHFKATAPAAWRPNEYWVEVNATRGSCNSTSDCAGAIAEIDARYDVLEGGWVVPFLDESLTEEERNRYDRGYAYANTREMLTTCATMCKIDLDVCAATAVSCDTDARSKHQPEGVLAKWYEMDWEDGDLGAKCVLPIEIQSQDLEPKIALGDMHQDSWSECDEEWMAQELYHQECYADATYHGASRSRAREEREARRGARAALETRRHAIRAVRARARARALSQPSGSTLSCTSRGSSASWAACSASASRSRGARASSA